MCASFFSLETGENCGFGTAKSKHMTLNSSEGLFGIPKLQQMLSDFLDSWLKMSSLLWVCNDKLSDLIGNNLWMSEQINRKTSTKISTSFEVELEIFWVMFLLSSFILHSCRSDYIFWYKIQNAVHEKCESPAFGTTACLCTPKSR